MEKIVPERLTLYQDENYQVDKTDIERTDTILRRAPTVNDPSDKPALLCITDRKRVRWDILIIFLTLYNCFSQPYILSFVVEPAHQTFLEVLDTFCDFLFIVDIILNFRTSYIDPKTGEEVREVRKIAYNYIWSGRLLLDILSSFPITILFFMLGSQRSALSLLKLLKLLRVLRLSKIIYYMRVMEHIKVSIRIVTLVCLIVLYLHVLACLWHFIVNFECNWIPTSQYHAEDQLVFYSSSALYRYAFSYYYALSTLVQFEISPVTRFQYFFGVFCLIVGALFFSYFLGEITVLVANFNRKLKTLYRTMDKLNTVMKNLKLPNALQLLITNHFLSSNKTFLHHKEWEKFRKVVPPSWIQQINLFLYKDLVNCHRVFCEFPRSVEVVVRNLSYKMLLPDQVLLQTGTKSTFFCFIVTGNFEVWVEDLNKQNCLVNKLSQGDYCGEIGLLYNVKRTATVRSITFCNVGIFSKEIFNRILKKNNHLEKRMKDEVAQYHDPYRTAILKKLRKVSYLHKLDSYILDQVFYSLEKLSVGPETIIFDEGEPADKIYFILEGKVTLFKGIYDSRLQRYLNSRNIRRVSNKITMRRSKRRSTIEKDLNPSKLVYTKVVNLCKDCIMCGMQALLECPLTTRCMAMKETKLLVLRAETITNLAKTNIQLRVAVQISRNKFHGFNSLMGYTTLIPPVIDCYRKFSDEKQYAKNSWRAQVKLKNCILVIIERNRLKITDKIVSSKELMNKLRAISYAEDKGWAELAKAVEKSALPPKAVYNHDLLSFDELKIPIYNQLAVLTKQTLSVYQEILPRQNEIETQLDWLKLRRRRTKLYTEELTEIADLLVSSF